MATKSRRKPDITTAQPVRKKAKISKLTKAQIRREDIKTGEQALSLSGGRAGLFRKGSGLVKKATKGKIKKEFSTRFSELASGNNPIGIRLGAAAETVKKSSKTLKMISESVKAAKTIKKASPRIKKFAKDIFKGAKTNKKASAKFLKTLTKHAKQEGIKKSTLRKQFKRERRANIAKQN